MPSLTEAFGQYERLRDHFEVPCKIQNCSSVDLYAAAIFCNAAWKLYFVRNDLTMQLVLIY